jgi:hypothetical protein
VEERLLEPVKSPHQEQPHDENPESQYQRIAPNRRAGDGQGDYPQHSCVWFDEGGWLVHGATDEQDITVLFEEVSG